MLSLLLGITLKWGSSGLAMILQRDDLFSNVSYHKISRSFFSFSDSWRSGSEFDCCVAWRRLDSRPEQIFVWPTGSWSGCLCMWFSLLVNVPYKNYSLSYTCCLAGNFYLELLMNRRYYAELSLKAKHWGLLRYQINVNCAYCYFRSSYSKSTSMYWISK